jgi:hypothetical protein
MTYVDLTRQDAEDLIAGNPAPDRDDLASVRALTAFMRATGEMEPAPPMATTLIVQIEAGSSN